MKTKVTDKAELKLRPVVVYAMIVWTSTYGDECFGDRFLGQSARKNFGQHKTPDMIQVYYGSKK